MELTDIKSKLQGYAQHAENIAQLCTSEEQTKISLINPYIELLGYDVRNPRAVRLEYFADVPGGRGEKIDYAIMRDDEPVILVEAKSTNVTLQDKSSVQLARYFMATPSAQLAIHTNGIMYYWYAADDGNTTAHKLADKPFLIHNVLKPTDTELDWLYSVYAGRYDVDALSERALATTARTQVRQWIERTLKNVDEDFARYLVQAIGLGRRTPTTVERVRVAAQHAFSDALRDRLQATLNRAAEGGVTEDASASRQVTQPNRDAADAADEILILESGEVLRASERPRAWRIGNLPWQREKNATQVMLAVVSAMVRRDRRRDDPQAMVEAAPSLLFEESKGVGVPVPQLDGLRCNTAIGNRVKNIALMKLLEQIDIDPKSDSPWNGTDPIEWWIPSNEKRGK